MVLLVLSAPNFFLMIKDLYQIKLGIMTKGYGAIEKENIVITLGMLGKASQNIEISYKCDIKDVYKS